MKGQVKIDEFAFVLLAGLVMIIIMMVAWSTTPSGVLEISPASVSLELGPGDVDTFTITLNGTASNISLAATGDIRRWISFDKRFFDISGTEIVTVTVEVPTSALEETYTGSIQINFAGGGSKIIPVSINVTQIPVVEYSYPVHLNDFYVRYALGTDVIAEKTNFDVSRGYFSNWPTTITAQLTDERLSTVTEGFVSVTVDETNGAGNFVLEFNGEEIFNRNSPAGEEIFLSLDKAKFQNSNKLVLSAGLPGWMFWMDTFYKIEDAKIGIDFQGLYKKEFIFQLDAVKILNFKYGKLEFTVKNSAYPQKNMEIIINNKVFFYGKPGEAFSQTFGDEISLNEGSNLISFSTEPDGSYQITDATLTIVYSV